MTLCVWLTLMISYFISPSPILWNNKIKIIKIGAKTAGCDRTGTIKICEKSACLKKNVKVLHNIEMAYLTLYFKHC